MGSKVDESLVAVLELFGQFAARSAPRNPHGNHVEVDEFLILPIARK
jgi:hypothetical protein